MLTTTTFRSLSLLLSPSDNLFAPLNNPEQADADGQDEDSSEKGFKADASAPTGFIAKVADAEAGGHV